MMRPPLRDYRTWTIDSLRWRDYAPRPDDIVIVTYPKSGTTWMQQIVGALVFQDPAPRPWMDISVWLDRRFGEPVEASLAQLEAQTHRRFLKAHLPADGLPIYGDVRYIHVARDGRDAALSMHNHMASISPEARARFDGAGLDDPTIRRPYPPSLADPADHFHRWMTEGAISGATDGTPFVSWFDFELSWWDQRRRPNVLLTHYADLKRDLVGEMRRIAAFLDIAPPAALWPELAAAAEFAAMSRHGDALLGKMATMFRGGGASFFHRGESGGGRTAFRPEDLALYDEKLAALPPDCAAWLSRGGRIGRHA